MIKFSTKGRNLQMLRNKLQHARILPVLIFTVDEWISNKSDLIIRINKEFIFSNDLGAPYEKMPEIYKQCYIGLRLTGHDGNANMVQEMEAMKIPVDHNHSEYGLKWKTVEDVVGYVNGRDKVPDLLTCSGKKILLNTHSDLDVTAGDTVMISNLVNSLTTRDNNVTIITPYMYKSFERNVTSNRRWHCLCCVGRANH